MYKTVKFNIVANMTTNNNIVFSPKSLKELCDTSINKPITTVDSLHDCTAVGVREIGVIEKCSIKENGIEFNCNFFQDTKETQEFSFSYNCAVGKKNKNRPIKVSKCNFLSLCEVETQKEGGHGYFI